MKNVLGCVVLGLLVLVVAGTGCIPVGPQADFDADVTSGDAPLTVQFTDLSDSGDSPITAWSWDFGDGDESQVQDPVHMYEVAGMYSISLTVTTAYGEDTKTVSFTVGKQIIMLSDNVPLVMVWIPDGTFMMGRYLGEQDSYVEEDPQHQVTLSQGFWMGKYALTKRQWTAVMGTTPWSGHSEVLNNLDSPAIWVSWNDAQAFIMALNAYTGLTFGLPSEAEREYAARAGTTTRFYWGNDPSYTQIDSYAWWYGNADNVGERYAHVVGQKLPNAFGLYDMSGNVLEWCEDNWHDRYTDAPSDGSAWVDFPVGSYRMTRGASWNGEGSYCRSASRGVPDHVPSDANSGVGFRLAR